MDKRKSAKPSMESGVESLYAAGAANAAIKVITDRQTDPPSLLAAVFANQWAYKSNGRHNSTATFPLVIFSRKSPSILRLLVKPINICAIHTYEIVCLNVIAVLSAFPYVKNTVCITINRIPQNIPMLEFAIAAALY
jgi:hypothetical protein